MYDLLVLGCSGSYRKGKGIISKCSHLLGGIYATLCETHALKHSRADYVVSGQGLLSLSEIIENRLGIRVNLPEYFQNFPTHVINNYGMHCGYVVVRTSIGCPFICNYCALAGACRKNDQILT
jgi:radical SAM superfamily enzyme YgiQ (UPF0313 family)